MTTKALKVSRAAIAHFQPAANPDAPQLFVTAEPPPGVAPATMAQDNATTIYQWATTSYLGYGDYETFIGFPALAEMTQRPEYRVMTETIARDMTRKWCKLVVKGDDDNDRAAKIKELQDAMDAFGVQDAFRRVAELDGFFGRGHLYIDTGATENPDELAAPMPVDPRKITRGSLKRLAVVEPVWTYPNNYNSADPLRANYYVPQSWFVMGKTVHRDRLLTFVSREVPDLLKPSYSFGGLSMTQLAKPYVDNWIRTRQSVSDLLHSFSKTILKTNMANILGGGGADELLARLDLFNRTRDNKGTIAVDMDTEEIQDVSTPLSSLDKLQAQAQEQMATVARIPLVVLFGISPSGLNASSEGEIAVYEAHVASMQEALFDTPLTTVLRVLQLHLWGEIDPDIHHEWNPIGEEDESTAALTDKTKADTDVAYMDGGVLSAEEVRAKLAADPSSAYHGLDLSDPPPEPTEVDVGDDPTLGADAWNEADHPRAENGQFGEGGGGHEGLAAVEKEWDDAGIEHFISESRSSGVITISKIVVPKASRSSGIGSAAMEKLVRYADRHRKTLALTPDPTFGGSKARLVEFYKRFGFVENRGRGRNYAIRETMYRPPRD